MKKKARLRFFFHKELKTIPCEIHRTEKFNNQILKTHFTGLVSDYAHLKISGFEDQKKAAQI